MELKNDKLLKIGELPQLKITPISDIIFHEEPDTERSGRLIEYLRKENILKNPPVVATHKGTKKFILLDGANRLTALQNLGIPDVLVQVIDLFDSGLIFLHWHHAVEKFSKDPFLTAISKLSEISISEAAGNVLNNEEDGELLCQIQFADSSIYAVRAHEDLFQRVKDLRDITNLYHGSQYMDRVSYTNIEHLKNNYPRFSALIVFRKISKEELVLVTDNGMRIPSGITRIILPKRALRLNVPLDLLRFDVDTSQKNHWLNKRINDQIKDKSIRFYHEPTFLFDE